MESKISGIKSSELKLKPNASISSEIELKISVNKSPEKHEDWYQYKRGIGIEQKRIQVLPKTKCTAIYIHKYRQIELAVLQV